MSAQQHAATNAVIEPEPDAVAITEEARAQQGIPRRKTAERAVRDEAKRPR
jgi:hypothetical protein